MSRFMYDKISISRSLLQWAEKTSPFQIILCSVSEQKARPFRKPKPNHSHHYKANKGDTPLPCTPVITAKISSFSMGDPFLRLLPLALFQSQNNEKLKQCRIISPNSSTFFPFPFFPSTSPSPPYSSGLPHPCPLPKWDLKVSWFFHRWGALKQTSR